MMSPRTLSRLAALGLLAWLTAAAPVRSAGADGPDGMPVPAPAMPPELARRVQEITEVVLEHHIEPPARQQMLLSGIRALYRAAGVPAPPELGRRASAVATPDQIAALLRESWPESTAGPIDAGKLESALLEGLIAAVPGSATLMTAKQSKVAAQFAGNRYIGIHVRLGMDEREKRPTFDVMPGGPADRAGVRSGDIVEEIDGVDTKGMETDEILARLRGDEGTDVTIKVRSPKEPRSRTVKVTRTPLTRPTIGGPSARMSGEWDFRLDGPDPIGYLRITQMAASTPHELRKLARRMEGEGLRALVLDLRGVGNGPVPDPSGPGGPTMAVVHSAVLLADSLLEGGVIGRIRARRGETTYRADPDALFRGWPIAVLVDQGTSGTAEWIAAALQDSHRAVIVGTQTWGARTTIRPMFGLPREDLGGPSYEAGVASVVPVGDGRWALSLVTGYLERGDGRPMSPRVADALRGPSDGDSPAGGVKPDEPVAVPRTWGWANRRPVEPADPSVRPDSRTRAVIEPKGTPRPWSGDPALSTAVTVLHKALEKR